MSCSSIVRVPSQMIRVTVELVPHGIESRARKIGELRIANDGSGDRDIGNYTAVLHAEYTDEDGRVGYVRNFKRRKQSVWSLIGGCLKLWGHTRHSPRDLHKSLPEKLEELMNGE